MTRKAICARSRLAFSACGALYAHDAAEGPGCGDEATTLEDETDGELRLAYAAMAECLAYLARERALELRILYRFSGQP